MLLFGFIVALFFLLVGIVTLSMSIADGDNTGAIIPAFIIAMMLLAIWLLADTARINNLVPVWEDKYGIEIVDTTHQRVTYIRNNVECEADIEEQNLVSEICVDDIEDAEIPLGGN